MLPTSWMCSACILILKRFRSRLVPTQQICHAKTPETKSLTTHPERHQTAGPPPWRLRTAMDAALLPADPARPATKDENLRFKTSKNSTSFPRVATKMLKHVENCWNYVCSTPLWADWIRRCTSTVKSVGTGQASALQRAFTISCAVSDQRILISVVSKRFSNLELQ